MLSKRNSKFKLAIFISILLHVTLIGFLVVGAMTRVNQIAGGSGGEKIDAIMVDPNAMAQQFDRQQQQKLESERAEYLRQEQATQQAKELQQKQQEEQQRLKQLEKERLEAQETARKAAELKAQQEREALKAEEVKRQAELEAAKAKAEAERQQQLALEARKKAEEEAAQRAAKELAEKQRIEKELQAAAEAKRVADAKAAEKQRQLAAEEKRKAEEAKRREAELKDLFGGLASPTNAPTASSSSGGGRRSGASGAEIDNYMGQIQNAIQNKFKDPQLYRGKVCILRIKLAPDGLLLDVKAEGGDPALCREAISATRMANIPKPPNKGVYEMFKDASLDFKPE